MGRRPDAVAALRHSNAGSRPSAPASPTGRPGLTRSTGLPSRQSATQEDDSVTGVIDRDGATHGDLPFDPVALHSGLHTGAADPEMTTRLDAALDSFPENLLRPTRAPMSLRMTDRAIHHFPPGAVGRRLGLASGRLSRPHGRASPPPRALSTDG
jgi:hypothetical protein